MDKFKNLIIKNKTICFWLILFILIVIGYFLHYKTVFYEHDVIINDVWWYFKYANDFYKNRLLPYQDFSMEYPPLSLLNWLIPSLSGNYDNFCQLFLLQNILLTIICLFIVYKLLGKFISNKLQCILTTICSLGFIILFPILLLRIDIFPTILCLLSVYSFIKYIEIRNNIFSFLAWCFVCLGTLVKIYPILLAITFFLFHLKYKDFKKLLLYFLVLGIIFLPSLVLIFLPTYNSSNFLAYHSERSVQVESLYGSILTFASSISDFQTNIVFGHQSYEIEDQYGRFFAQISLSFTVIFIFILIVYLIYKLLKINNKNKQIRLCIFGITMSIAIFIITNKVFSLQYIIWILPFFIILNGFLQKKLLAYINLFIIIIIPLLALLIYPIYFEEFLKGNVIIRFLSLGKNILLILETVLLFVCINKISKKHHKI